MSIDISGVDLTGQVAVVMGNRLDLSRAIVQAFRSAGAQVGLVVNNEQEFGATQDLIEDGRIAVTIADLTNRVAVKRTAQSLKDQFGTITLLVNVADEAQTNSPLWQVDPAEWSRRLEINLRGLWMWTKAVLPEMAVGGRIVNIAEPSLFSRLMDSVAAEAKAREITLYAIEPGAPSDLVKKLISILASGQADNGQGDALRLHS